MHLPARHQPARINDPRIVGTGGIGITLNSAMNLFNWDPVTVILIAIFVVVMASEWGSALLRRQFT